jgi:adenylate cyclase
MYISFGSINRFDFTIIGDSVNTASRIEDLNKHYKTNILVSDAIYRTIPMNEYLFRALDKVRLKGKGIAVQIFELKCEWNNSSNQQRQDYVKFDYAMNEYLFGNFEEALDYLNDIVDKDYATVKMIEECEVLIRNRPQIWDAIRIMYTK